MKQTTYILILLLALSFTACKKKSMVVIQAQNLNDISDGSHYAGMKYAVTESWTPYLETKTKVIESGVLDDNGHASFDLKMKGSRKYYLGVQEPDGICYSDIEYHQLKQNEFNNNISFIYAPCAYSKLIIDNINCTGENDTLVLYRNDDLGEISSDEGWVHKGCVNWESPGGPDGDPIGYSSIPNGNVYYKWIVIRSGVSSTYYDTVYYDEGEYKTYKIEY